MIDKSGTDRRHFYRAKRILDIRHSLYKRGKNVYSSPPYISDTQDMSVNGILFSSSAPYHVDDIVELEVNMAGALNIFRGYGRVVRVEKKSSTRQYSIAVTLINLKKKLPTLSKVLSSRVISRKKTVQTTAKK